ncbi:MAG: response regulator [Bauldia sp.]|jgi:two-component system cell cycle response regulator DivK
MTRRVLVIEDTEDNRRILRDLLASAGYHTVEAQDGGEGLALARSDPPDLVLLDIQLPVMDGYEVARRMRTEANLAAVPIVAVTSFALAGDEGRARAAGCDAYVSKPFSPRELLALVRRLLPPDGARA